MEKASWLNILTVNFPELTVACDSSRFDLIPPEAIGSYRELSGAGALICETHKWKSEKVESRFSTEARGGRNILPPALPT
jgi:hypothetical protein